LNFNKKVSFDVISNDIFLLNFIFLIKRVYKGTVSFICSRI
jgi:hypothetical protein